MKITYALQKSDEIYSAPEEKGAIDLDTALQLFENFTAMKFFPDKIEGILDSNVISIIFTDENKRTLKLSATNNKGVSVSFENSKEFFQLFLPNLFEGREPEYYAEDFIEFFFNSEIENKVNLTSKDVLDTFYEVNPLKKPLPGSSHSFSSSGRKNYKKLYFTLPFLIFSLLILRVGFVHGFEGMLYVQIFFGILWVPGIILHLSYGIKNNNAEVFIKDSTCTYEKNGKTITFKRSDIYNYDINESKKSSAPWGAYRYFWVVLHDRQQIVITNFVAEPEEILDALGLEYKVDEHMIPFLPLI